MYILRSSPEMHNLVQYILNLFPVEEKCINFLVHEFPLHLLVDNPVQVVEKSKLKNKRPKRVDRMPHLLTQSELVSSALRIVHIGTRPLWEINKSQYREKDLIFVFELCHVDNCSLIERIIWFDRVVEKSHAVSLSVRIHLKIVLEQKKRNEQTLTFASKNGFFRRCLHRLPLKLRDAGHISVFVFANHFAEERDVADGQFQYVDFAQFLFVR